jgi:hypothetical protein
MTSQLITKISHLLIAVEELIHISFSRKMWTWQELSRFKTTKFRLLLLYVLLTVILKNKQNPDVVYNYFMLLRVAILILCLVKTVLKQNKTSDKLIFFWLLLLIRVQSFMVMTSSLLIFIIFVICRGNDVDWALLEIVGVWFFKINWVNLRIW